MGNHEVNWNIKMVLYVNDAFALLFRACANHMMLDLFVNWTQGNGRAKLKHLHRLRDKLKWKEV